MSKRTNQSLLDHTKQAPPPSVRPSTLLYGLILSLGLALMILPAIGAAIARFGDVL